MTLLSRPCCVPTKQPLRPKQAPQPMPIRRAAPYMPPQLRMIARPAPKHLAGPAACDRAATGNLPTIVPCPLIPPPAQSALPAERPAQPQSQAALLLQAPSAAATSSGTSAANVCRRSEPASAAAEPGQLPEPAATAQPSKCCSAGPLHKASTTACCTQGPATCPLPIGRRELPLGSPRLPIDCRTQPLQRSLKAESSISERASKVSSSASSEGSEWSWSEQLRTSSAKLLPEPLHTIPLLKEVSNSNSILALSSECAISSHGMTLTSSCAKMQSSCCICTCKILMWVNSHIGCLLLKHLSVGAHCLLEVSVNLCRRISS